MKWIVHFSLIVGCLMFWACDKEPDLVEVEEPVLSSSTKIIYDEFDGIKLVLVGNQLKHYILAFNRVFQGQELTFTSTRQTLPALMEDQLGNLWDIHGYAISGPDQGERLEKVSACMGYWFAFGSLYPGAEIYEGTTHEPNLTLDQTPGWLVAKESVYQGAGFDAIKSLQYPEFLDFDFRNFPGENFYLDEDDLVVGIEVNGEVKAYPHRILDYHEVINDRIGGIDISIIYCPLTGTSSVWEQSVTEASSEFGVSGFLYSSNIIPFDRHSESLWSQLEGKCINGRLIGTTVKTFHFVETTWNTWRNIYNTPQVVSENTGVDREYSVYPYSDYKTNHNNLIYPIQYDDDRLPRKERVFGIISNSKAKVYRFESFK